MSTITRPKSSRRPPGPPPLAHGQQLTQAEFHRRYEAYPDHVKAELIGGIVYMASPLGRPHGSHHVELGGAFWLYKGGTPGTEVLDNTTTILGQRSEPQPDLTLRILPEWGGRSQNSVQDYVLGPPELLAQIADSSRNLDLHQRKDDYERAGVVEYLVVCVAERELHWFNFASSRPIKADRQGIFRSRVFPGLWIDQPALFDRDSARIMAAVQEGLVSRQHAAFVKRLQAAHRKHSSR